MEYLKWMGENPFLTFFILVILTEFILRLFTTGRIRAIKCPACGFKSPSVKEEEEKEADDE
jgi:hypothetical protein